MNEIEKSVARELGLSDETIIRQAIEQQRAYYPGAEIDARPPADLPTQWSLVERRGDGASYVRVGGLRVITSAAIELDGKRWLHVSFSYAKKMPTYEDMAAVKKVFVGPERAAIQVFPKTSEHINLHKFCLHLWCCLDGDVWPDFTHGGLL